MAAQDDSTAPAPGDDSPAPRPADAVIARFGGVRVLAEALHLPLTTVFGWKERGVIPEQQRAAILAAAAARGLSLTAAELEPALAPEPPSITDVEAEIIQPPPAPDLIGPDSTGSTGPNGTGPDAGGPGDPAAPADSGPRPLPPPGGNSRPARDSAPPPRRGGSALAGLALLVSLAALGVGGYGLMRAGVLPALPGLPAPEAAPDDPRFAALAGRAEDLERQLVVLRAAMAEPPSPGQAAPALPAAIADLPAKVADLERRVTALANSLTVPGPQAAAPTVDTGELASLRADMAGLSQRLATLEAGPSASPDSALAQQLEQLAGRLTAVEGWAQSVAALTQRQQALEQTVTELTARLDQLNGTVQAGQRSASTGEALVVAAGQLQAALEAGRAYVRELAAVRGLAGAAGPELAADLDSMLAPLAPAAETGLPPALALHTRFKALAPEIIQADRLRGDADWTQQTLGRISALVTVRRSSGEVAGDGVDAIVARAEAAVDKGDLAKAVTELEALGGPAADKAAPWLRDARARVAADQAARHLADLALARLSGQPSGSGPAQPATGVRP